MTTGQDGWLDWCPTKRGSHTAYKPQWFDGGVWREVPVKRTEHGVPQPLLHGGINSELHLFGYEQAMALAWTFAACAAAEGKDIDVRVQPFDVVFDLKARECEKSP